MTGGGHRDRGERPSAARENDHCSIATIFYSICMTMYSSKSVTPVMFHAIRNYVSCHWIPQRSRTLVSESVQILDAVNLSSSGYSAHW